MLTLRLFHGRRTPKEQLEGWGADGPTLGPLESAHIIYGGLSLAVNEIDVIELSMINALIYYDGMFYGDAALSEALEPTALPVQSLADPKPALLRKRDERGSVMLPADVLPEYQRRLQVFADSIRELAGDRAADSINRALANVVRRKGRPGRKA